MPVSSKRKTAGVLQRGALIVTMRQSTPMLTAATNFSISVTVTNPFDVPVSVEGISTLLPIDLFDVNQAERIKRQLAQSQELERVRLRLLESLGLKSVPLVLEKEGPLRPILRGLFRTLPYVDLLVPGVDVALDMTATALAKASEESTDSRLDKLVAAGSRLLAPTKLEVQPGMSREEIRQKVDEVIQPLQAEFEKQNSAVKQSPIIINPGDAITNTFVLKTRKGLMFTPSSYNLDVTVKYRIDETVHSQTVPYTIEIQSAQSSVITGAIIGSIFGVLVTDINFLFQGEWLRTLIRIITIMIISSFAVIAFARKAGVQPIVSIQDFWGGLLIGFLIAYSGQQILGGIFSSGQIPPTPTPIP